ncbi:MAG: hypothetical protein OEU92_22625, partial [Alphaproteobacteria bacterium]|nr:hypothetical protein [Alphaproteobacteria bacterium]
MKTPAFDIVVIADWRQAGPVFWYQRNLIEAALAAGYRLAALQVDGPGGDAIVGLHPWFRQMIEDRRIAWLDPLAEAEAGLTLTVDGSIIERPLNLALRLKSDLNIVIATRDVPTAPETVPLIDRLDAQFRGPVRLAAATDLITEQLPASGGRPVGDDPIWRPAVDLDALRKEGGNRRSDGALIVGTEVAAADELGSRLLGWRHRPLRLRGAKAALMASRQSWPEAWHVDDLSEVSTKAFCERIDAYLEGFRPGCGGDALCTGAITMAGLGGLVLASPKLGSYLGKVALMSDAPSALIDGLADDDAALSQAREQASEALLARHDWRCHQV